MGVLDDILGRRKEEERVKKEGRLPPGQSLTQKFPVLHYGPTPGFNEAIWDLRVFGEVEKETRWTWQEFQQLPTVKITTDIHCVTRWSKFDTEWEGVRFSDFVKLFGVKPTTKHVIAHCEYGYTTNTPVEMVLLDNFLLATHYDGKPLDMEHGWPLRGVIGSFADRSETKTAYFWKGGKWLRGLEFRKTDQKGFWENAGYNNEADPWTEQRYAGNRWF